MATSEIVAAGMAERRANLGDAHVDRSVADVDPLWLPLQEMIAAHCWRDVWTREDLGRRDRSLITVAMLAALCRDEELRLHLQAARRNGLSPEELREVVLQVGIYAGMPAAIAAGRAARAAFKAYDTASANHGDVQQRQQEV